VGAKPLRVTFYGIIIAPLKIQPNVRLCSNAYNMAIHNKFTTLVRVFLLDSEPSDAFIDFKIMHVFFMSGLWRHFTLNKVLQFSTLKVVSGNKLDLVGMLGGRKYLSKHPEKNKNKIGCEQ